MTIAATKKALSVIRTAAKRARTGKSRVAKDESVSALLKRLKVLEPDEAEPETEDEAEEEDDA